MLLTADIGNTNITLGFYEKEELKFKARLATDKRRTDDQYAVEIRDILSINGYSFLDITGSVIGSVVPSVGNRVMSAIKKLCHIDSLLLGPGVKTGLNIRLDNPAQLGADLAAGAVGALQIYNMPCIIIDMGTATTMSVLGADGTFLGGVIAAGIELTLQSLVKNTAQLPDIHISAPRLAIGTNTIDSMKSGLLLGAAAMLDGMINRIESELGLAATVVATGGLAREVVPLCLHNDIILNDDLLLDGLRIIYEKNRNPQH